MVVDIAWSTGLALSLLCLWQNVSLQFKKRTPIPTKPTHRNSKWSFEIFYLIFIFVLEIFSLPFFLHHTIPLLFVYIYLLHFYFKYIFLFFILTLKSCTIFYVQRYPLLCTPEATTMQCLWAFLDINFFLLFFFFCFFIIYLCTKYFFFFYSSSIYILLKSRHPSKRGIIHILPGAIEMALSCVCLHCPRFKYTILYIYLYEIRVH